MLRAAQGLQPAFSQGALNSQYLGSGTTTVAVVRPADRLMTPEDHLPAEELHAGSAQDLLELALVAALGGAGARRSGLGERTHDHRAGASSFLEVVDHLVQAGPGHQSHSVARIEQTADAEVADIGPPRRGVLRGFSPDRSKRGLRHHAAHHDDVVRANGPELVQRRQGGALTGLVARSGNLEVPKIEPTEAEPGQR